MNKNDENEIRKELNEGIDETLSNLLLGVLAKFMLEDIDNHDMEVADKYISNLRRMLIDNKKKGNK